MRVCLGSSGLEWIAPLLSFMIPALIRWVPEAQFPYPIGFDTPSYLAEAKAYSKNLDFFPLLFRILGWMYAVGLDSVVAMKFLPTLFYGFLGISVYYFARSYLGLDRWRSLLTVGVLAFSVVSLRVSWDLNKQVFATVPLFLALSQLKRLHSPYRSGLFVVLGLLVASSHQLVFALMSGILLYLIVSEAYRFCKGRGVDIRLISVALATLGGGLLVFLGGWYGWSLLEVHRAAALSNAVGAAFEYEAWITAFQKYTRIFVICYGLLLPFIVLGFFRQQALTGWMMVAAAGSLSSFVSPWFGFYFFDRWTYLLIYPSTFYVAAALKRLKLANPLSLRKSLVLLGVLLVINVQSLSFLGLCSWPEWLPRAPSFFPELMAVSSIPIQDIEATAQLLGRLNQKSQDLVLIVHINYLGWASYYSEHRMVAWIPWSYPGTLSEALDAAKNLKVEDIYLLWYGDQDAFRLGFSKFLENGPMKLYKYEGSGQNV